MNVVESVHANLVHPARIRNLTSQLGCQIPEGASLLDVGCGDGQLAALLAADRRLGTVQGIDVQVRPDVAVCVQVFDGIHLPFPDRSWDYVMAVDVMHHADDPPSLLRDMLRVSRRGVLIKDHLCENTFDRWLLLRMDKVGNDRHGVPVLAKYLSLGSWHALFRECGATVDFFSARVRLYPFPLSLIFGRQLHCIFRLHGTHQGVSEGS